MNATLLPRPDLSRRAVLRGGGVAASWPARAGARALL
jgi:hypothetical protein